MPEQSNRNPSDRQALEQAVDAGLKLLSADDLKPNMPCPDSEIFALYVQGEVDGETRRTINQHIAFCKECYREYLALAEPLDLVKEAERELQNLEPQYDSRRRKLKRRISPELIGYMSRTPLAYLMVNELGVDKALAATVLAFITTTAIRETKSRGQFMLPGLGRLKRVWRAARVGRNPQTGQPIRIPGKNTVKFYATMDFRDAVKKSKSSKKSKISKSKKSKKSRK